MGKFKPQVKGIVRVRPGRNIIWLARQSTLSIMLGMTAVIVFFAGLIVAGVPVVPMVWYRVKPSVTMELAKLIRKPVVKQEQSNLVRVYDDWQPQVDTSLQPGERITIPAIKLTTPITEAAMEQYEWALSRGVWRVPDFGTPDDRKLPMILAAHRFGYLSWSNTYRREHSFFNLPKLTQGDRIEIIWNQRKYVYEVYAWDEGTTISDYSADLILYTCQYLESDIRIFKYARLIKE